MNYEKKYKEALERAKKLYEQGTITESLGYVFPELKESENESIRKTLISFFRDWERTKSHCWNVNVSDIIAWLGKQGENKHAEHECPHWISVKDELPPMRDEDGLCDKVLTHSKEGGIYLNRYNYGHNTWDNAYVFNITHWMPLPQAPKGGEK